MQKKLPKIYCFVNEFNLTDLSILSKDISIIYRNYDNINHLDNIPTGTWGSVVDRFLTKGNSGWDLLNAATDELWHKEKPTVASYNHNATIVDGLCNWVSVAA